MRVICDIAEKWNLLVLEDASEAHGSMLDGRMVGGLSDIAAFSFYANKILTAGEGGIVVTNDEQLYEKLKYYRNLCFNLNGIRDFIHCDIGFNYRMSNLHAAIALAQLEKIEEYVAARVRNAELYQSFLMNIPGLYFQVPTLNSRHSHWMNAILINPEQLGLTRDHLMNRLKNNNIDSRMFFTGMHKQPALLNYGCSGAGNFATTDFLAANGLYLPSGSNLEENQIAQICDRIIEIIDL
jgi:perosamine synthetase